MEVSGKVRNLGLSVVTLPWIVEKGVISFFLLRCFPSLLDGLWKLLGEDGGEGIPAAARVFIHPVEQQPARASQSACHRWCSAGISYAMMMTHTKPGDQERIVTERKGLSNAQNWMQVGGENLELFC